MDDQFLIEQIKRRDQNAMNALYNRYVNLAYGVAFRVLEDNQSAEECVQDAFLKIWQNAPRFDAERGSLIGWMVQIVRHSAIDIARQRHHRLPDEDINEMEETLANEGNEHDSDRIEKLRQAIEGLPIEQRQAIELSYFGDLSQTEIAERLALPIGTVKTRMRLGMQKLRTAWSKE